MPVYNPGGRFVRFAGILFLIIVVSVCAGCGGLFEQPGLKIHTIHVKKIKNLEVILRVDVEVYNPNLMPFEIKSVECEVELEGKQIASVNYEVNTAIPSRGTAIIPFEVHSTSFDIISKLLNILKSNRKTDNKRMPYRVRGKINLSSPFYAPSSVPFSSDGDLLEKLGFLRQK
jgi:LEA14-like dessication related protein